jgi:hypothetical protein
LECRQRNIKAATLLSQVPYDFSSRQERGAMKREGTRNGMGNACIV